jgi:hypothetical protein
LEDWEEAARICAMRVLKEMENKCAISPQQYGCEEEDERPAIRDHGAVFPFTLGF